MAKSITFNIQQGGLGRRRPGSDYISAIIMAFTTANLPSGFAANDRIKKINSLDEAIDLGITEAAVGNGKILYYHIDEFFRLYGAKTSSIGELWLNLYDDLAVLDVADFRDLQTAASGDIRQFSVYPDVPFAGSLLSTAGTAMDELLNEKTPAVCIMGGDLSGFATIGLLPDVRVLDNLFCSVDGSQDGTGRGAALFASEGKTIGGLGAILAITAAAKVSDNIGWVAQFDISDNVEYQQPAIGNGILFDALTDADINTLQTNGLIFARKRNGIVGAYYDDAPQAVAVDSDFAYIENARTMQKAIRGINEKLLPFINSPLQVNATTGFLSEATIFELESAVLEALELMATDTEISVDEDTGRLPLNSVFIDPDQNILATSKVNIVVRIVPIGVQRETVVNIGFTPKIAQS
jgi:hypothetical protein